jgi:hypothetical protein
MEACWKIKPQHRMPIDKILETLKNIRVQASTYLQLESDVDVGILELRFPSSNKDYVGNMAYGDPI